jgi:diguanylate cyclase
VSNDNRPQAIGARVLRFLDEHRLDHSPLNYAFAHRFLFESDRALVSEVKRIIDGGVRINPGEVARLSSRKLERPDVEQDNAPQLDQLTLRVLDIIGEAANATGDLSRDLIGAAASLLGSDGPNVRSIVTAMIERTSRAEASFADATRQAQTLRDELNTVRNVASRDRLTGLLNRHAMEEKLSMAVASAKGCAIAFVDVDRFKVINDTHGHGVGDRVLKVVAETLVEACHPHAVARWGGEEFIVLMEDMIAADAGVIVDAARSALAKRRLKLRENDAPLGAVSFSAGVLSSRGRTVAEMMEGADALLYQAKNAGRNRVEVEPALVRVASRDLNTPSS